ncbi:hypothetical protein BDN72DRAFT_847942 [Pluteus cervinus]|uniref:Uncharacterized protein n=1 Tax=Pluteus cervinus TaxID=181527 RepID=A0ACD3AC67_9AGAR|nr:hypothetical protein BDN72DRAFT_847942 [Pluteus cervinus]
MNVPSQTSGGTSRGFATSPPFPVLHPSSFRRSFFESLKAHMPRRVAFLLCLTFLRFTLPRILLNIFFFIYFFYLPNVYLYLYGTHSRLPSVNGTTSHTSHATTLSYSDTPINWQRLSERLENDWRSTKALIVVLLTLSVTLLQLNDITSREVTKTATVLSFWFAIASLVCGCINAFHLSPMQETYESVLEKSRHKNIMGCILWIIMILPVSFAVWSSVNFVVAAAVYSFSGPSPSTIGAPVQKSVLIFVLVVVVLVFLFYLPVLTLQGFGTATQEEPSHSSDGIEREAVAVVIPRSGSITTCETLIA